MINRFSAHGVIIRGAGAQSNKVEGNFIGTNAKGTADRGNHANGVVILFGKNNTIGGTQPARRNVISGNGDPGDSTFAGVAIQGSGATGNHVEGNFIGTNAKGTEDLGNTGEGVIITDVPGNTVGGTDADDGEVDGVVRARNVISGNGENGVQSGGSEATGNEVEGNRIGTTAVGTGDLGNDVDGVFIGAPNNTIGGTASGAGNVISGNGDDGVTIFNSVGSGGATGNKVEGNGISGNTDDGVVIGSASNNTVGGTASGAGNGISANGDDGVEISGSGATGNGVLGNSIVSNTGLGIDLSGGTENTFGVTANDSKDLDTGATTSRTSP